jgi:hypothetical protein
MAKSTTTLVSALVLIPLVAAAQQPPRPTETPRSVTLTLAEYNRLIDLASRPAPGPPGPPVAAVLASADLRVRVERDTARGVFNVSGDVLRAGVSRVGLLSGATLIDANAGGRPVPLVADGNAHVALVPGPGPFSLALEWGTPLIFRPGRASFVLPVPQAGTARATIDLPGEQADVRLSAGLVTRRTVADGRTIVEATLDPGSSTEVWWSMRDSAPVAAAREVRTLADVMTLMTLGDSDLRMAVLIDLTVVQGELRTIGLRTPAGYELTGVSGSTVETSERREDGVVLTMSDPAARGHQVLVTLERPHEGGSFSIDTGLVTVPDAQRERGEIAVEGVGTLELTIAERDGMQRIDVRELTTPLQSLARLPMLAAFRYQRSAAAAARLSLDVKRFEDARVLAAVADSAVATTLVTTEGRVLTEVALRIQNRAQPFLKVSLPQGATMVSVDVAGETAKPVLGADGTRVPLLRPGFRPHGPYVVSFVYLHAGTPLERKGDVTMMLPQMDIPVGIVKWELFVPERYSVRAIDGNVVDARTAGDFFVADSQVEETVTVTPGGTGGGVSTEQAGADESRRDAAGKTVQQAPQNVINLQRRTVGVLPVRVDVPRAGTSHRFIKPLMVDQEAFVRLRYRTR